MNDLTLSLAFDLACKERDEACSARDQAVARVAELEALTTELEVKNNQMVARLRVVELMEEQAGKRLGFRIPVRLVDAARTADARTSLKGVQ